MKRRLKLAEKLSKGELSKEEHIFVSQFPIIIKEGERLIKGTSTKTVYSKKKGVK